MPFPMQPGQIKGSGGNVPDIANVGAGSITCYKGECITITAGVAVLHALGATVTNFYGVALEAATSGVSKGPESSLLSVAKIDRNTYFVSKCVTSGALTTDLSGVAIGDQYGLLRVSNQDYVDLDDTTNVVCQVAKIDDDLNIVWILFLESTIQEPNG